MTSLCIDYWRRPRFIGIASRDTDYLLGMVNMWSSKSRSCVEQYCNSLYAYYSRGLNKYSSAGARARVISRYCWLLLALEFGDKHGAESLVRSVSLLLILAYFYFFYLYPLRELHQNAITSLRILLCLSDPFA